MFFEYDNLYIKKQNLYPLFPFLSFSRVTFRTKYGRNKLNTPWLLSPMSPCPQSCDVFPQQIAPLRLIGTLPMSQRYSLAHNLSGRDSESERPPEYSLTDTQRRRSIQVATQNSSYSKRPYKFSLHFSFMSICQCTTWSMLKTELFPQIHLFLPVVVF